jgi:beta-glucosidase
MAGCDFSDAEFEQYIPEALYSGYVTEERLNDALRRVLTVRMRLGEFDEFNSVPYSKISPEIIMAKEHRQLSLMTAEQSIVLLKNNGILPLNKSKLKRVAVIGPYADLFNHANYGGIPLNPVKPLQGIINELGNQVEVIYEKGGEINFPVVRKGFIPPFVDRSAVINKAVEAAKKSDAVFLFIGTNTSIEIEGMDRETLNLSGNQQQLLDAVMAANPNTIVILMSAGPLAVPTAKKRAAAILQGWWPGEEGGTAIANVIFGKYNPAGRLPYTMYESDAQVPPVDIYDISVGFTYMYLKGKPQYAFGHGLSYSKFNYSNLRLSGKEVTAKDVVKIDVDVRNNGKMSGDEVVQLYIRDLNRGYVHPVSELRGFKRVSIPANETKRVNIELPVSSLAYYDTSVGDFQIIPGKYEILIGAASDDIRLKSVITIK